MQRPPGRGPRGRPVLGAVAGLLFGLFLAVDLLMLGVIVSDSPLFAVLPAVFLVAGFLLGVAAPLRRRP